MNFPDSAPGQRDESAVLPAENEGDDVEGHRMLSPQQAQERSDAARQAREQRLAEEAGGSTTTS